MNEAFVGAYLQCYKNRRATEFVTRNFRLHHPDSPIYLVSDLGDDFEYLVDGPNFCAQYSYLNLGRQGSQNSQQHSARKKPITHGFDLEETLVWLFRLNMGARFLKSRGATHLILLEDDVWVKGRVSVAANVSFCGGENLNNKIDDKFLNHMLSRYKTAPTVDYYCCCGGVILSIDVLLDNYCVFNSILIDDFDTLVELDARFGYLDFFLHFLYSVAGGEYVVNESFVETWMPVDWRSDKYTIVHQYKELY
jgi:hypothetical protein